MQNGISSKGWLVRFSIPIFIVIISTICFQVGVNVENISNEQSKGIIMHILYSLSLFTLGGVSLGKPEEGPQWAVNLLFTMYYLAPAISFGALIEHLFSNAKFYLRYKILKGNHFVIIGAGRASSTLPRILNDIYKNSYKRTKFGIEVPIIIADKNPNALLYSLSKYNIQYFDSEDPTLIEKLNLMKSRSIFILTDNDWANINLFFQLNNRLKKDGSLKNQPDIFIRIDSEDLLNEMKIHFFKPNYHFFNIHIEAITLMLNNQIVDNEIYQKWMNQLKSANPETIVLIGFGRFGQHILSECLNDDANRLVSSLKKVVIVSPNAKNDWEHFELMSTLSNKNDYKNIEVVFYESTNENLSLIKKIVEDDSMNEDKSVLWVMGSGDESVNLHTSTIVKRYYELNKSKNSVQKRIFMLIRSKTMNNTYDELINKLDNDHIMLPTFEMIGGYYRKTLKEISKSAIN